MSIQKKLINGLIITFLISTTSGFFYGKNVQAAKLEDELQTALKSDNYENAKLIHQKVNSDIIITKLFSFNEKAGDLTKTQFSALKTSYLEDSITYEEFNLKLNSLNELSSFNIDEAEKQAIEKIESFRQAYRLTEKLVQDKNYKDALVSLKEIEADIDSAYKSRVISLAATIKDSAVKEIEAPLNNFISKKKYTEALNLLEENKEVLSEDYYTEKVDSINKLIQNKNSKAVSKNKAAEEKEKKAEAKLIPYLDGYIPNPIKENAVISITSKTIFLVWVDITEQTTNIFVGNKGNWKFIRSLTSSTGSTGNDTPKGTYTIKDRGKWFFSKKYQQGGQYWVRFMGNYLFHSIPMDESKQVVDPTLGTPASHGCVRLSIDDAAWFYNTIPAGTTVYIK